MKKHILLLSLILSIVSLSCNRAKIFEIRGKFLSANDDVLFFEHRGLAGIEILDSVRLKEEGNFKFKQKAPSNPEFYQLRVNNNIVVFSIDSTETLYVEGDVKDLKKTFKVENSVANEQIKQIDLSTNKIKTQFKQLEKQHDAKKIDDVAYLNSIDSILSDYKSESIKIILGNPAGAAAYYAVFQKVDNYLIFDPYDKRDYAMYGAVATSWDKYYNGSERSKHLHDFAMKAMKQRRSQEQQVSLLENVPIMADTSLPDIELREVNGEKVPLSSLKGKVVVLDFTVYNSEFSPKHNIDLNSVYSQLRSKGVEIYQISFDSDEHLWKNSANNLPWVTVRDPQSVYSKLLAYYNVRDLPTAFVIDRNGDIVARVENLKTLSAEINKVL